MERSKRAGAPAVEGPDLASHSRLRAAADGSPHALGYAKVREVLLGYLSATLVDAVLDRALTARRLLPQQMTEEALQELASDVMVGLRLFVPEQRLSQLMLDLADVLDRER